MMGTLLFILVIAGVTGFFYMSYMNQAIAKYNRVKQAWSDIDVLLLKRNEAIRNQINFLMQTLDVESKMYKEIAKVSDALQKYNSSDSIEDKVSTNNMIGNTLVEITKNKYPELQSLKQNFLPIFEEWKNTETDISNIRMAYNRSATKYNTGMRQFPSSTFYIRAKGDDIEFPLIVATEIQRQAIEIPSVWSNGGDN